MRDETSSISQAQLLDFDWKLHVMLSSDKMSEIRQPVLALKLQTQAGGQQAEDIEVEMTKEELDRVLKSMDTAMQVR